MTEKFLGLVGAVGVAAVLAIPSGAQAQSVPAPTGCAAVIPINLAPVVNVTIKTCEAAEVPSCNGNSTYIPLDPITRIRIDTCVP